MIKMLALKASILAGLFSYLATPAQATLSYVFHQTSGTPDALQVLGSFTIVDESIVQASYRGTTKTLTGSLNGLLDFRFSGGGVDVSLGRLEQDMAFCANVPFHFFCEVVRFDLFIGPHAASVSYLDTGDHLQFNGASGVINRDVGLCGQTDVCRFEGEFVAVSEPTTLALFGVALLGLMRLRSKRASRSL